MSFALFVTALFAWQSASAAYCTMAKKMSDVGCKETTVDNVHSHSLQGITIKVDGTAVLTQAATATTFNWLSASKSFSVKQGQEMEITLTNGLWSNDVWIGCDWNGDEEFEYVNDIYPDGRTDGGTNSIKTLTIKVPEDAKIGSTRIRFVSDGVVCEAQWDKTTPMCGTYGAGRIGYAGSVHEFGMNIQVSDKPIPERTITLKASPSEGGTVSGGGTSDKAINCTATPAVGYIFVNWTNEATGDVVSTSTAYTDYTEGDKTLVANFLASYPIMSYCYTNNLQQSNRYLKNVTATQGSNVTEVFNATTEAELPREDYTGAFSDSGSSTKGALIDKTTKHIIIDEGATSFTVNFKAWTTNMTLGGTSKACELDWSQQALYIDWNNNRVFTDAGENYGKNSNVVPNSSFTSAAGYTRTINVPAGQPAGTYRMRICYYEPSGVYTEAWDQTLFTTKGAKTRNGKSYDFVVEIKGSAIKSDLKFAESEVSYPWGEKEYTQVAASTNSEGAVSYSLAVTTGDADLATIDAATGKVTFNAKKGVAVITATQAAWGDYAETTASYTLNIILNYDVTVNVASSPVEGGAAKVDGYTDYSYVSYGETCELTATPALGYNFAKWTKDGEEVSKSATYNPVIKGGPDDELNYTAVFEKPAPVKSDLKFAESEVSYPWGEKEYTQVAASTNSEGAVSYSLAVTTGDADLATIDAATGKVTFNTKKGVAVITATQAAWGSYTETTATYTLNIERNYDVTVIPAASPAEGGVAKVNGYTDLDYVQYGKTCELTATPALGYNFAKWTKDGEEVSKSATYNPVIKGGPDDELNYTAVFEKQPIVTYTMTATVAPVAAGAVRINGTDSPVVVAAGDRVTFEVATTGLYKFVGWIDGMMPVSEDNPYVVESASKNLTLTALCELRKKIKVNLSVNNSELGSASYMHTGIFEDVYEGENVVFMASSKSGASFVNWTDADGNELGTSEVYTVNNASKDMTVKANFAGTLNSGINFTKEAVTLYLADKEYTQVANDPNALGGITYSIAPATATIDNSGKVTFSSVGAYVITATQAANGKYAETKASYTLTVAANPSFRISATASPAISYGRVYVNDSYGAKNVEYGKPAVLEAIPSAGYVFVKWTKGGADVSTLAVYTTDPVKEATDYIAVFDVFSGVNDSELADAKVWFANGMLNIEGIGAGDSVKVYATSGAILYDGKADGSSMTVDIAGSGLYIIKINGKIFKATK